MYLDIFVINIKQDTTKNFGWKNKKKRIRNTLKRFGQ